MSQHSKPSQGRVALAAILVLGLGMAFLSLHAQDADVVVTPELTANVSSAPVKEASPAAHSRAVSDFVYNSEGSAQAQEDRLEVEMTPMGLFSKVMMFLIVLCGLTYGFIHYAKKGKINVGALKAFSAEDQLIVSETRMLGNRQYLMVVEYGAQKILLAVTPGNVKHLCFLETPFEENVDDVIDDEYGSNEEAQA